MPGVEPNWSHDAAFAATPTSASAARAFVSQHLVDHRLLHLLEPVRLVVSELATNALVHGRTPITVTLSQQDDAVRVMVSDDAEWVASRGQDQDLPAGGRGLGIVQVLSRDWGVVDGAGSKTVWASFATGQR